MHSSRPAPFTHRRVGWMLLLVVFTTTTTASTSVEAEPAWTLQVDPLTTALGYAHVQVEYAFAEHWSLYLGPHLHLFPGILAEDDDVAFIGLGAELGFRYYFMGEAPKGAWVLLRGVFAHLSTTEGPDETSLGGYVSALGGYTWIFDDRWVLSAGAGIQYLDYEVAGAGPTGPLPAAHTAIGVAF